MGRTRRLLRALHERQYVWHVLRYAVAIAILLLAWWAASEIVEVVKPIVLALLIICPVLFFPRWPHNSDESVGALRFVGQPIRPVQVVARPGRVSDFDWSTTVLT